MAGNALPSGQIDDLCVLPWSVFALFTLRPGFSPLWDARVRFLQAFHALDLAQHDLLEPGSRTCRPAKLPLVSRNCRVGFVFFYRLVARPGNLLASVATQARFDRTGPGLGGPQGSQCGSRHPTPKQVSRALAKPENSSPASFPRARRSTCFVSKMKASCSIMGRTARCGRRRATSLHRGAGVLYFGRGRMETVADRHERPPPAEPPRRTGARFSCPEGPSCRGASGLTDLSTAKILTVTELTQQVKVLLEEAFPFQWVAGEMSGLARRIRALYSR